MAGNDSPRDTGEKPSSKSVSERTSAECSNESRHTARTMTVEDGQTRVRPGMRYGVLFACFLLMFNSWGIVNVSTSMLPKECKVRPKSHHTFSAMAVAHHGASKAQSLLAR
jgi:hypothetical protein